MESDDLRDLCADFVTEDKYVNAIKKLLVSPMGQWMNLPDLIRPNTDNAPVDPDLFVTWVDDPYRERGYVCILFFHYSVIWSKCAIYNKGRLFGDHTVGRVW
jgi:hypothetical protein